MHACVKECDVIDTKKEVVLVSITSTKINEVSFVKVSLLIGMPVPHGCFVRQSCCSPSSKAVVTDFVSEKWHHWMYHYWWKKIIHSKCNDKFICGGKHVNKHASTKKSANSSAHKVTSVTNTKDYFVFTTKCITII